MPKDKNIITTETDNEFDFQNERLKEEKLALKKAISDMDTKYLLEYLFSLFLASLVLIIIALTIQFRFEFYFNDYVSKVSEIFLQIVLISTLLGWNIRTKSLFKKSKERNVEKLRESEKELYQKFQNNIESIVRKSQ